MHAVLYRIFIQYNTIIIYRIYPEILAVIKFGAKQAFEILIWR